MNLSNLLGGKRILEKNRSKYNGELTVLRDLTWGTYIKAGGLTQSGGVVKDIWAKTLKEILKKKPEVKTSLILGLGGGSAAKLIRQYWVTSNITGVDIDKKIVDLGKKYMKLDEIDLQIKIDDAYKFVKKSREKYDLILVDLYNGDKFPEKFEKEEFLKNIKKVLSKNGVAVFNRLYGEKQKAVSMEFGIRLEKYFKKVDHIFPMANVVFVCYN